MAPHVEYDEIVMALKGIRQKIAAPSKALQWNYVEGCPQGRDLLRGHVQGLEGQAPPHDGLGDLQENWWRELGVLDCG